jgi:hypothetical protein
MVVVGGRKEKLAAQAQSDAVTVQDKRQLPVWDCHSRCDKDRVLTLRFAIDPNSCAIFFVLVQLLNPKNTNYTHQGVRFNATSNTHGLHLSEVSKLPNYSPKDSFRIPNDIDIMGQTIWSKPVNRRG